MSNAFASCGFLPISVNIVLYWSVAAAVAVLFDYSGHYGNYACRFCHRAAYASQKNNQIGRKRLAASKLRLLQLGGWPDINEPMPSKPKWTRRKAYQHVRNEIQALEAKAKTRRFRKPIPHSSSPITSARTKSAGGLRDQLGNPGQDGRPAGPALQV
jgi:hypothetical protein